MTLLLLFLVQPLETFLFLAADGSAVVEGFMRVALYLRPGFLGLEIGGGIGGGGRGVSCVVAGVVPVVAGGVELWLEEDFEEVAEEDG
jgi:hypothetical protein